VDNYFKEVDGALEHQKEVLNTSPVKAVRAKRQAAAYRTASYQAADEQMADFLAGGGRVKSRTLANKIRPGSPERIGVERTMPSGEIERMPEPRLTFLLTSTKWSLVACPESSQAVRALEMGVLKFRHSS